MAWLPNVPPLEPPPDLAIGEGLGPLLQSLAQQIPQTPIDPMPMMATHPIVENLIKQFGQAVDIPSKAINKTAISKVKDYLSSITHDPEPYTKLRGMYTAPKSVAYRGQWDPYSGVVSRDAQMEVTKLLNNYHAGNLTPVGAYRSVPGGGAGIDIKESLFKDRGDELLRTVIHELGHHRQGFSEKPFGAYEYVRKFPKVFDGWGHHGRPDEAVASLYSSMEMGEIAPKTMVSRYLKEQAQKEIPFGEKITKYSTDSDWQNWLQGARKSNWFIDPKDPEQTRRMLIGLLSDKNRGYQAANVISKRATGKALTESPEMATQMKKALGDQTMENIVRRSPNEGYGQGLLDFILRAGIK